MAKPVASVYPENETLIDAKETIGQYGFGVEDGQRHRQTSIVA
ncbi:MAG TPA: hypothetical protein VLY24_26615 [Bryobacteraceae bacterium]|nr:hypothetical protein [Bryobacteraceae bacterium]